MTISALSADQIAEHQLLAALRLWHQGDFLSALTLAGAAEEILGKRLRKLGREPTFDQMKSAILALMVQEGGVADRKTEKLVADLMNSTKNELKHYDGDSSLEFDLRADAEEIIERALANHQVLTGVILEESMQFWASLRGGAEA